MNLYHHNEFQRHIVNIQKWKIYKKNNNKNKKLLNNKIQN